eukprot:gene14667-biopygen4022
MAQDIARYSTAVSFGVEHPEAIKSPAWKHQHLAQYFLLPYPLQRVTSTGGSERTVPFKTVPPGCTNFESENGYIRYGITSKVGGTSLDPQCWTASETGIACWTEPRVTGGYVRDGCRRPWVPRHSCYATVTRGSGPSLGILRSEAQLLGNCVSEPNPVLGTAVSQWCIHGKKGHPASTLHGSPRSVVPPNGRKESQKQRAFKPEKRKFKEEEKVKEI